MNEKKKALELAGDGTTHDKLASRGRGKVYIGTSGIVLPGPKATFPASYQAGSRLQYYGSLFNTLEINSSFYKMPLPTTYEKWATEVPTGFELTIKLWREITHAKHLAFLDEHIDIFLEGANRLGDKKGCLLIQFPASITDRYVDELHKILEQLDSLSELEVGKGNKAWRIAIEFRHSSWYSGSVYTLLKKYKASIVIHDMPNSRTPIEQDTEILNKKFDELLNDFVYLRFHGPTGKYNGSYTDEVLKGYVAHIEGWVEKGTDVYVYFNNTMEGALGNAQTLQQLLQRN